MPTPAEQRERFARALNRAHGLVEEWAGDPTPITRAEAARLLADVLDTTPGVWTEAHLPDRPHLHVVPDPQ